MFQIPENITCKSLRWTIALVATVIMIAAGATPGFAAAEQKSFATPDVAVKELVAAVKAGDAKAMLAILGPDAKPIIQSGDAMADKTARERFVTFYEEANKLEESGDAKAVLSLGKDNWPFPIPIVKAAAGWRFDTNAGKAEIINRRIGRNELAVIQVAMAYADAQRDYYRLDPQQDKVPHFAQKFVSTQGKKDGLYFPTKAGEKPSPLGPLFESAKAAGYTKGESGKPAPYYGYHYRILKGQGPDAKGGAYDYVAQGRMIGGFALVAWPVTYANSGVMTFIVNHDAVVYEKDLGPQTASVASKMTKFNPDKTWKSVSQ